MCSPAGLMTKGFLAFFVLGIFWRYFRIHSECFELAKGKFGSHELLNLNPKNQFRDSTSNFADLDRPREERTQHVGHTCLVFHAVQELYLEFPKRPK